MPRLAVALTILPVLVLTLAPGPYAPTEPLSPLCVICGWRGASDAILNIWLLIPFGLALGALGVRPAVALGVGLGIALSIELAQFLIPNRSPGLGDVLYNGSGTAIGAWLWGHRHLLLGRGRREETRRLLTAWGLLGATLPFLFGWLLVPAVPPSGHEVQWTPETEYGDRYGGEVLSFSVAGDPRTPGRIDTDDEIYVALGRGTRLDLSVRAGEPPGVLVPLVRLRSGRRDDLELGLDRTDLIVRYRTRGMALRLDRPYPRWRGATESWTRGDSASVSISALRSGLSAPGPVGPEPGAMGGEPGVDLSVPTARSWGLLMFPPPAARAPERLDFVWLLLLALPLGFWGSLRAASLWGLAWAAALFSAPLVFPLVTGSSVGVLGIAAALPLGALLNYVIGNPKTLTGRMGTVPPVEMRTTNEDDVR